MAKAHRVHHECVSWVKGEYLKRSLVFLGIRQNVRQSHSIRGTASEEPIGKFLILFRLVFGQHIVIQFQHFGGNVFVPTTAYVLDWFADLIGRFERYNLICSVLHNHVVDFRADFLYTVKDWLLSLVIPVQVINLCLILQVRKQCLL